MIYVERTTSIAKLNLKLQCQSKVDLNMAMHVYLWVKLYPSQHYNNVEVKPIKKKYSKLVLHLINASAKYTRLK